jgi:hypothetical protein
MPSKQSQIHVFDFTIAKECYTSHEQLCVVLHKYCKKWAFQLEAGTESGTLHYQCRVSLMKKLRPSEAVKMFRPILLNGVEERFVSITPTSKTVTEQVHSDEKSASGTGNNRGFNYVLKEETRVEGPWTDETFEPPRPMSRQLKEFMEFPLRPFQQKLTDMCKVIDNRYIKYIIEETGGTGKSIHCEYLTYHKLARRIPAMKSAEDISQMIMSLPPSPCYIIDMPRAMRKENLWELYTAIEELKNGYCYDKRYSFRDRQMDRPQIIVFSNQFPELSAMSMDRWQIYRMIACSDPAMTDLQKIDPNRFLIEDAVNKALIAAQLSASKDTRKRYSDITSTLVADWMAGKTRSEIVDEVERRADMPYEVSSEIGTVINGPPKRARTASAEDAMENGIGTD